MKQKIRTFRIWDSTGIPRDIQSSTIDFSKGKDGLTVKFDKPPKLKGVVALIEVPEPVAAVTVKKTDDDED